MYTTDYLLNKKITLLQPVDGYRASIDAVLLSSLVRHLKKDSRILDIGSGTGAIAMCLAHRFRDEISILGLEVQEELASLANQSAQINGFDNFLRFLEHNIKNNINELNNSFDICISNPPYSENDLKSPKQSKALAHNHQDMTLESWLKFCLKMLKPKGQLYMINRTEALQDILYFLHKKIGAIKIVPIFSKAGEAAKRVMIIANKDSKAPLEILPGIIIHQENGEYTKAANQILRDGLSFFD